MDSMSVAPRVWRAIERPGELPRGLEDLAMLTVHRNLDSAMRPSASNLAALDTLSATPFTADTPNGDELVHLYPSRKLAINTWA